MPAPIFRGLNGKIVKLFWEHFVNLGINIYKRINYGNKLYVS
jgi:hypothetical protein